MKAQLSSNRDSVLLKVTMVPKFLGTPCVVRTRDRFFRKKIYTQVNVKLYVYLKQQCNTMFRYDGEYIFKNQFER